jgi:hypothetical protein
MLIVLKIFQIWETERRKAEKEKREKGGRRKKDRKEHKCKKGQH